MTTADDLLTLLKQYRSDTSRFLGQLSDLIEAAESEAEPVRFGRECVCEACYQARREREVAATYDLPERLVAGARVLATGSDERPTWPRCDGCAETDPLTLRFVEQGRRLLCADCRAEAVP